MQELRQEQSFQELQLAESNDHTPDSLVKEPIEQKNPSKKAFTFNIKRCMFLIFMIISSTILLSEINALEEKEDPYVKAPVYEFYVYCPYSYRDKIKPFTTPQDEGNQDLRRRLYEKYSYSVELANPRDNPQYNLSNLYVVEMRSIDISKDDKNINQTLAYCGLATNSSCDKFVQVVCSSPGPMFDLTVGQHTDIVWINNLNSSIVPSPDANQCFDNSNPRCILPSKLNPGQTYNDPTQHVDSGREIIISQNNWPTSTHVHGAEVRPTFDGNPISWVDNNGHRGLGAFTMKDTCYYSSFDQGRFGDNSTFLPPDIIVKNVQQNYTISHVKINRYPNIQNPGNLWYHDHAMRLTKYNVQQGLNGIYILRDQKVQRQINVDKSHQKFVMIGKFGWQSKNLSANIGEVYRFRFINNNFFDQGTSIYFSYSSSCEENKKINFTIIGADSSLLNRGIENSTSFIIGSAERIELLIKFQNFSTHYSICQISKKINSNGGTRGNIQKISLHKNLKSNSVVGRTSITNVNLSVAFVDLSKKTPVKSRMRPLIKVDNTFTINGRTDFHWGKSEDPTIGTIEDWYIINTFQSSHPLHIHLINFQVIQVLNLRKYSNLSSIGSHKPCSIYELDFMFQVILKSSAYSTDSPVYYNKTLPNYPYICENKGIIYQNPNFTKYLESVNVENVFNQTTNVSGIDVKQLITQADKALFQALSVALKPTDIYKYIENDIAPPTKQYYRRWKDTALVEAFQVNVVRIRWAKSAYDENNKTDTYFNVPVDQLREYPGFLYHCHLLGHQDNEMMRPIMLQLPEGTRLSSSVPCNEGPDNSWSTKVNCINKRCPPPSA